MTAYLTVPKLLSFARRKRIKSPTPQPVCKDTEPEFVLIWGSQEAKGIWFIGYEKGQERWPTNMEEQAHWHC